MQSRPIVVLSSLIGGVVLASLIPLASAAEATTSPAGAQVTVHANSGCGGITKVYTPAPGHALSPQALHLPSGQRGIWDYAAKHHVRWLSRLTCRQLPRKPVLRPAPGSATASISSGNWSGYQLTDPSADEVEGFWSVPAVTGNGQLDSESSWVGLGGGFNSGSGELLQDGTESDVSASGATNYYFWFEDFPLENQQMVTNLIPNPGESVAADTAYDTSTGTTFFTLCDFTQNICVDGSQVTDPPGSSVEWIVERTMINGNLPPLARYVAETFSNCLYFDPGNQNAIRLIDGSPSPITMFNNSDTLSVPQSINSDGESFSTLWKNFQ